MRTEKCESCTNYRHVAESERTGREWMNSTGWCDLPSLSFKRRRIDKDNWCDNYCEAQVPSQTIGEALEIIHVDGAKTPPEFEGLAKHVPDAEVVDDQTYEQWREAMRSQIAEVNKSLRILNALIDQPIGDLE